MALVEPRPLVRQVVRAHLEAEAPELVPELETAFEALYATAEERARDLREREERGERGVPFDPGAFGTGAFLATTFWVAFDMLRAGAEAADVREMKRRLRRRKAQHWRDTQRPELVVALHERVVDVLEWLRRFEARLVPSRVEEGGRDGSPDLRILVGARTAAKGWIYLLDPCPRLGLRVSIFFSPAFFAEPRASLASPLKEVDELPQASDEPEPVTTLRRIGEDFTRDLLSEELRQKLLDLRSSVRTIEVVCDENWVPWELLRLWPRGGEPSGGQFLCELFAVTRGTPSPAVPSRLALRHLAAVVPRDPDLPHLEREAEVLLSLVAAGRTVERIPARRREVIDALRSGHYDAWHFAGHCDAREKNPGRWRLVLDDGELLARDVSSLRGRFAERRPLVFLNACSSARAGLALSGLRGVAPSFLEAGAAAVVGTLWPLRNSKATAFAELFYRQLFAGIPLGECVRTSRLQLRDRFAGDPTWLAYTAYGHPLTAVAVEGPAATTRS
jgi:hypothetical protein